MKWILTIIILSFLTKIVNGQATESSAIIVRNQALTSLRNFRDELNGSTPGGPRESVLDQINKLVSWVRTLNDTTQSRQILNYFNFASKTYQQTSIEARDTELRFLGNDLLLKLAPPDTVSQLQILNGNTLFKPLTVNFAILLGGRPSSYPYTVYWAIFLGKLPALLIKGKEQSGSSIANADKFEFKLVIPGYYTFWIERDGKYYQSEPDYFILKDVGKSIPINFIPVQP